MSIEKMESVVSFKLPDLTKQGYDALTKEQKKDLHHKYRIATAEAIHMAKFNPRDYLGDEA
jgi:hypothetical protein